MRSYNYLLNQKSLEEKINLINYQVNEKVNFIIDKFIHYEKIQEISRYVLLPGGKKLRSLILLLNASVSEVDYETAIYVASIIEIIHTYTLIQDDLPGLDNDDYRRGKLTCHKKYDESTAILISDGLLTLAFQIISSDELKISPEQKICLINQISDSLGINKALYGQYIDLHPSEIKDDEQYVNLCHELKTAELMILSAKLALYLGKTSEEVKNRLVNYTKYFALAFQIKDDILDVEGSFDVVGKSVNKDARNAKKNFITLYGMEYCKNKLMFYSNEAEKVINVPELKSTYTAFYELIKYNIDRMK